MSKRKRGVFVPHTQWDREWRYPIWKNRSLLVDFMTQLLAIIDDDPERTLALTLFRSVRNRICTEWRSTGNFPEQKGGQLLQTLEYEYAIYPHSGDWSSANVYSQALMLNAPAAVFQFSKGDAGVQPTQQSMFSVEPAVLQCSALKKAEDRDSVIMRLFNPSNSTVSGTINFYSQLNKVYLVNLNEQRIKPLDFEAFDEQSTITLDVKVNEIVTMELLI